MVAKALVLQEPRRLILEEFPIPQIGENDALLRVEACGLCGTDHEQYSGMLHPGYPFIPGHESVGVIEEIGSEAADRWGVSAGERVAVEVFQSCGKCDMCMAGIYRRCTQHGVKDMYGFIPVSKEPALWGGYSQYQYLAPDSIVHRVPSNLDPVVATIFNPLGAGIRWGVTVPDVHQGAVVAVLGPGIRGLSACAALKEAGAAFVMITGKGARDRERLELSTRFGADLYVDVDHDDPAKELFRHTGRQADVVVDVTAKAPAALAQAISAVKEGGTIVMAGTRGSADTPGFWPDMIVYKEIHIIGALGVDSAAYRSALDLLASGKYPFAELPRRTASLEGAAALIETMGGLSKSGHLKSDDAIGGGGALAGDGTVGEGNAGDGTAGEGDVNDGIFGDGSITGANGDAVPVHGVILPWA